MGAYALPTLGLITDVDNGRPLGVWSDAEVLKPTPGCLEDHGEAGVEVGQVLAAWSGTLGPAKFESSVSNWTEVARQRLHAACDAFVADHPRTSLWLRPHARHVLGDWNTAARFVLSRRTAGDQQTGLLIDPCSLLTRQMLPRAIEHLERAIEEISMAVGGVWGVDTPLPAGTVKGIVVAGVWEEERQCVTGGESTAHDPLGIDEGVPLALGAFDDPRSVISVELWRRLLGEGVLDRLPVLLPGEPADARRQAALLGL